MRECHRLEDVYALVRSELEVYMLVGKGLSNKEIAKERFTSVHTVRTQLKHIYSKLGIAGRSALAVAASEDIWKHPNRFAGAIELLRTRDAPGLHTEAIEVLMREGTA